MVKMVDVAQHAGVSIKTVSRVINNEPNVQKSLQNKVRQSIDMLGYIPSSSARSLRSGRSFRIHLISDTARNRFANTIQCGALLSSQLNGYQLGINLMDQEKHGSKQQMDTWLAGLTVNGKPDGLILVPPMSNNPKLVSRIIESGLNVVGIGAPAVHAEQASLTIDNTAAARELTEYLIALGHQEIGFVRGREDQPATHERFAGYREALEQNNIAYKPSLTASGNFHFESGLAAGEALLRRTQRPTAIFASNDDMAVGVLVAAHRLGVSVPGNLSIAGFDDSELAQRMWPDITTIRQPLEEFGTKAMQMLIEAAGKRGFPETAKNTQLKHELIIRGSTSPAA